MAKKQTELSVLMDIRDFLMKRFPHEPVLKPAVAADFQGSGLSSLLWSPDRLEKLSDGWFKDHFLTLFYGKDFIWSPVSLEKHINWQDAEEYVAKYGRQADDFELSTLIDRSKRKPAIIDAAKVLELKTVDWYWTNRSVADSPSLAWCVDFGSGNVYYGDKDYENYVRPVRLSQ